MIELQKQQIELFKNSEENYMKFQRDMLNFRENNLKQNLEKEKTTVIFSYDSEKCSRESN